MESRRLPIRRRLGHDRRMRRTLAAALLLGCGQVAPAPDAAPPDAAVPPDLSLIMDMTVPTGPSRLSHTGLYGDFSTRTYADGIIRYTPRYPLWSDGAEKARYLLLPPNTQIDTSDMDNWQFPVGTRVWKEFTVNGQLIETRLLQKEWNDPSGWWECAYLWAADGSDATCVPDGMDNANGTTHYVPSQIDCGWCHGNVKDVLIGISAIQLSSPDGKSGAL